MKQAGSDSRIHFELSPEDKILPCPFCGSHDIELCNTHTPSYWMECQECDAQVHGEYGPDLVSGPGSYGSLRQHEAAAKSAIAAWNRRA